MKMEIIGTFPIRTKIIFIIFFDLFNEIHCRFPDWNNEKGKVQNGHIQFITSFICILLLPIHKYGPARTINIEYTGRLYFEFDFLAETYELWE